MNHGEVMVVWIVAIVMIASIFRAKYGYGRYRRRGNEATPPQAQTENLHLHE
jgi:hypothetical protein